MRSSSPSPVKQLYTPRGRAGVWLVFTLSLLSATFQALLFIALGSGLDAALSLPETALSFQLLAVLALGSAGFSAAKIFLGERDAKAEEAPIRRKLVSRAFELGPSGLVGSKVGDRLNTMTDGVERLTLYRQTFLGPALSAAAISVMALGVIGWKVNWFSALIIFLCLPAIPVVIVGFQRMFARISAGSRKERGRLAAAYLDAIQSLETLRLLGAAERRGEVLAEQGERNRKSIMRLLAGNQLILFVVDAGFSLLVLTVAAALALWQALSGAITPGQVLVLLTVSLLLLEPLDQLAAFFYVGMGGLASRKNITKYLGIRPVTPMVPYAQAPASAGAPGLELRGVAFHYQEGVEVLSGIDLQVAPGERLAIVGPSGRGKTTLLSILGGYLAPTGGEVLLDGRRVEPGELRAVCGFVAQSTWLFTDSVAGNLRLAKPGASEAEMWAALEAAQLADEVRLMPQGLETQIGERGMSLSGGQAARLSIARALLAGRPLILLDEPTAQVDRDSETKILQAIRDLPATATVIMVTHRESSLALADRVFNLDAALSEAGGSDA